MNIKKINEILELHRKWLKNEKGGERANLQGADSRYADLRNIDLRYANLKGVNLDFSCMPLWCGDLKANYDERQIIQQLFHVLSHVKFSTNSTKELKDKLLTKELLELANRFHVKSIDRLESEVKNE